MNVPQWDSCNDARHRPPRSDNGSLSDKLQWLLGFGTPTLRYCPSKPAGWVASIEMTTNTPGAQFNIRSAWDHAAPDPAVDDLIQRVKEVINA